MRTNAGVSAQLFDRALRRRHQHRDDLHQRDPHLGRHARRQRQRRRCASCTPRSASTATTTPSCTPAPAADDEPAAASGVVGCRCRAIVEIRRIAGNPARFREGGCRRRGGTIERTLPVGAADRVMEEEHVGNTNGVNIGVVGATGQVGAVVRRLLEERDFPVAEIRYFASARSRRHDAAVQGRGHRRRGRRDGRPDRASTSRSSRPAPRSRRRRRRGSPPPACTSSTTRPAGAWTPRSRSS